MNTEKTLKMFLNVKRNRTIFIIVCALIIAFIFAVVYDFKVKAVYKTKVSETLTCHHFKQPFATTSQLSFASYYEDHMVLQRKPSSAVIWGYGDVVGAPVCVSVYGSTFNMTFHTIVTRGPVPGNGVWRVTLNPVAEPGPFVIVARSGGKEVQLKDVLFGDVWMCSGQSNMQFTVRQALNVTEELSDSFHYPNIRIFTINDRVSTTPQYDLAEDGILLHWSVPRPGTLGGQSWKFFSSLCWLYGKYLNQELKYPIGLISGSLGSTAVETWSSDDALRKCGLLNKTNTVDPVNANPIAKIPESNSLLWNAMIHPFVNMSIFGVIWYQGEDNRDYHRELYACTFPAMIDDWRLKFHQGSRQTSESFPFGFVQLAPYRIFSEEIGYQEIRWHQTSGYGYVPNQRMTNTFMAVAMDLPDFSSSDCIHPRDKDDIAKRLARGALTVAYNRNVPFQGPFPVKFEKDFTIVNALAIHYNQELDIRILNGFVICCLETNCHEETSWLPSPIIKKDVSSITISTLSCVDDKVAAVRYAWKESPCAFKKCAIYSKKSGLPAPPFKHMLSDNDNT